MWKRSGEYEQKINDLAHAEFDQLVRLAREAYQGDNAVAWAELATARGEGSLAKRAACDYVEDEARGWKPRPDGELSHVELGTR